LPANTDTTPVWSPDGRRLVVAGESDTPHIVIRSLGDGGSKTVLPMFGNEPAWSPDGKLIAFQSHGKGELLQIYLVRPDGSALRQLTKGTGSGDGASEAAWAPDGRRIAFTADFDGDQEIYIVRIDGTGLRKLTRTSVDEMHPAWSPDGRRLAFARSTGAFERTAIVVIDLKTARETEIASAEDPDMVFEPTWQPAGAE
jgi:TolB protein